MTSTGKDYVDHVPGYFHIDNTALDAVLPETHPLSGVPPADRIRVAQLVERVLPEVAEWAHDYPIMGGTDGDHSRVVWICLCCCATFAAGPGNLITDYAALALSINSHDDVMDGVLHDYSLEQLTALTERCIAIGEQRPTEPDHDLTEPERQVLAAYRDSFARIAGYRAFAWSGPYLARHWRAAFEAMLRESRWRLGADPLPDLPEYLTNATLSLFLPLCQSALITMSDLPRLPGDQLQRWDVAARQASLATRMCNDLRTAARERTEGGPNALDLIIGTGQTEARAISTLQAKIDSALDDLDAAIDALPATLTELGEAARRQTHFACGWYLARDTHGLTARQLRGLVTTHPSPPDR